MTAAGTGPAASSAFARVVGAFLRHPAVLPVKRRIVDARWRWRARGIRNPPLPPGPIRRILFLCQGNICRSPFAALLAQRRFAEHGAGQIECLSAGLKASQHPTSPPEAVAAAAAYGIALDSHGARDVTVDELAAADVIVVMEVAHVERVRRRAPHLAARVQLLPLYEAERDRYGGREQVNLLDPFGHDAAAFAHCYRRIEAALRPFVAAVLPSWGAAGPAARS